MGDLLISFIIGGFFVAAFAVLIESLRPKSFAGPFGSAPSVALATLLFTIHSQGVVFAASEARSMVFGAAVFFVYGCAVWYVIARWKGPASIVSSAIIVVWLGLAMGIAAIK